MIFYFSGTGNSRYVAESLSRLLGQNVVRMTAATYSEAALINVADPLTVWVFPIHSWGLPDFVVRFIKRVGSGCGLPFGGRHYMVCTCGDDIGLAHRQWRKLMSDKGWNTAAAYSVRMPNTYVVLPGFDVDSHDVASDKLDAARGRIEEVARDISAGSVSDDVVEGGFPWIKSRVIYPYFMRRMISPKPFMALADRCIGCGRCVSACPLDNVRLDASRRPVWGDDCTLCLGCYHVCPEQAVQYGGRTKGKGRYYCVRRSDF